MLTKKGETMYLNDGPDGPLRLLKATMILGAFPGAYELSEPPKDLRNIPPYYALICIVNNGMFDAAVWIDSNSELGAFTQPHDKRPKRWILIDEKDAKKYAA